MIGSLTTSDLRNTLCGRLKLQKTQKMKITLSQIQSDPLLAYCRTLNFDKESAITSLLSQLFGYFFKLNFPSFDEIVFVMGVFS